MNLKIEYVGIDYIQPYENNARSHGKEDVKAFCKINAFKYLWRLGHKDEEAQEIGKIKWYLDKYLELSDDSSK